MGKASWKPASFDAQLPRVKHEASQVCHAQLPNKAISTFLFLHMGSSGTCRITKFRGSPVKWVLSACAVEYANM